MSEEAGSFNGNLQSNDGIRHTGHNLFTKLSSKVRNKDIKDDEADKQKNLDFLETNTANMLKTFTGNFHDVHLLIY